MNFGTKIQIRWFARFLQNSIFGTKIWLLTQCDILGIQPKLWTLCIIIYTHNTKKRCFLNLRQALESLRLDVTKTMKESMKHTTKNLKGKWTQHPLWLGMNFILSFVSFTWYLSSLMSRDGNSERQATVMRQFCQFTKFWN